MLDIIVYCLAVVGFLTLLAFAFDIGLSLYYTWRVFQPNRKPHHKKPLLEQEDWEKHPIDQV